MTKAEILERYHEIQEKLGGGCSDGYCVIKKPKGMHTNGGCRCLYRGNDEHLKRSYLEQLARIAQEMAKLLERT